LGIPHPQTPNKDKENRNNLWHGSIALKIGGIMVPPGSLPREGYQLAPLRMIYTIKPDLCQKSCLVIGGLRIKADDHSGYGSIVQITSIHFLSAIAKAQGLQFLTGDIGNAYLYASTREKMYFECGTEFGPELNGRIAIEFKSSGNCWLAHFAKTLFSMGFELTHFDPDKWIELHPEKEGYDYISTYVDDIMITA
jgi:hypothetical protein